MITLYGGGAQFGLPDSSPFVSKTEILLKMSKVPYRTAVGDRNKAPKTKIPYIEDGGKLLGDSTFIRWHLEDTYGADFDKGLSDADKATAWAYEKMCEDHLYWAMVDLRWNDAANFDKGPRTFFNSAPAPMRPFIIAYVKRLVRKMAWAHGMGRHTKSEIERLAIRDIDAIAAFLGNKPWLMGDVPCSADAAVWSMVAGILSPTFDSPLRLATERHANLLAYRDRGLRQWFPDFSTPAPAVTAKP